MTDSKNAGELSPALVETVAGLSAGSMATLIVHPLDIVKTRMQIHRSATNPSAQPTTVSVLRSLATQSDKPIAALYRGLTPNLLGNATSWASFFFFKSRFERGIVLLKSPRSGNNDGGNGNGNGRGLLTPQDFFAASLLAGAATQVITNPIWVLKTRMLSSDRNAAGAYPSMWTGATRLLREEGFLAFYRGLGVGMLAVSHGAVQFAVYDPARRIYFRRRRNKEKRMGIKGGGGGGGDDKIISNEATIVLSTVSKLVAGATTYPLQVLRSRLQNYHAEEQFGSGVRGVVRQLWLEEGVRGFYRGIIPGVVRVLPATWVTFLVYENVKFYLPRWVAA
ncbi:mitochondrial carrier domain-containing protein [Diplogelasinospora grovesii]|uniref:Mitochondrial carrier domain-containing protein n=1 Tax=Diplogelasinospora grovesii TaxID=303347 RepID=A0AAN6NG09_9PEZI|nr:mitochondrial carrier domain-containing protein [Diplogelasinospora grovesii]